MREKPISIHYFIIFFISALCILLELFWTRILNLKAWNHVVYVIIPFAILGYGIGANIQILLKESLAKRNPNQVLGFVTIFLGVCALVCTRIIISLGLNVEIIVNIFRNIKAISMLLTAYTIIMLPFVIIGFLIVYLFQIYREESHKLYFFDLVGAGVGAILFFPLINNTHVFTSILILSFFAVLIGLFLLFEKKKLVIVLFSLILYVGFLSKIPEPINYAIDKAKGWEWIPGYFKPESYQWIVSRWHSLGRTDVFRIPEQAAQKDIISRTPGAFQINLDPKPEFSYFSTNFLAGTPAYNFSEGGLRKYHSKVKLFSQSMEAPYLLLKNPRVVVIGAGGGRDIFMAKSHGAKSVVGAEINPGIVAEMSPGGTLYDYSGRIYTAEPATVYNIDGRHLVKKLASKSVDFVVLNGVDTFSGLSSGAYAYAESYLYTKEALQDYFRILDDGGVIMFVRWLFSPPRETLRLYATTLQALAELGVENPQDHVVIGAHGCSITLIKKQPFAAAEKKKIIDYFHTHGAQSILPADPIFENTPMIAFEDYTKVFKLGQVAMYENLYPYDITVVNDDRPFFYKYYKFSPANIFKPIATHHTGTIIFLTQFLVLLQGVIFILLFLLLPLLVFPRNNIRLMPKGSKVPFVTFYACLGLGFMLIEIPLMQQFVLLLGSPIYAITVILAILLIGTGCGSLCLPGLQQKVKGTALNQMLTQSKITSPASQMLFLNTVILVIYTFILIGTSAMVFQAFASQSLFLRVLIVSIMTFPLGFILGAYFPAGLKLISAKYQDSVSWAWAINSGFSVIGSMGSIILAQFWGFKNVMILACIIYLIAFLAFQKFEEKLS